jgi:hypothetical protein
MNSAVFDFEALLRGIVIGLGIGLIVTAITHLVLKIRRGVAVLLGMGAVLILTTILFYAWPSRIIEVPNLANLSLAEAELSLAKKGLIPEVTPQPNPTTEARRVVPYSQDPSPGIKVRKNTVVRFVVSMGPGQPAPQGEEPGVTASVSLFQPRSDEEVHCRRYGDDIYRFSVEGVSTGVTGSGLQLLLWVKPANPPSETPGWYLQRGFVNGIHRVDSDGSWRGIGQIGNVQWPPHEGDIFNVAVTVVNSETAQRLLATADVVTRIDLPGIASDEALGVRVRLK